MNYKNHLLKSTLLTLILFAGVNFLFAQTPKISQPRQEKLLNGLKLLVWNVPNSDKVTLKLRIHSGSAFDPKEKEGAMALLAAILFPNEGTKDFFREDLGGSLDIESNYDYIQINATADSDKILTLLETVANAVANPQIDKETVSKVASVQREKVKELENNPSYVADLAAARRLFGDFPYGRAQMGTSESLQKIDFADLIFVKERFLTADNATLAIIGNVKPDFAYRAVRRYFGAWEKADKKVPATFAQPEAPDKSMQIINLPAAEKVEIRTVSRGLGRNDKDFAAAQILIPVLQEKWSAFQPESSKQNALVELQTHFLPGVFIIKTSVPADEADSFLKKLETSGKALNTLTNADFEKVKTARLNDFNSKLTNLNSLADLWLDVDTYKLIPIGEQYRALQTVTFEEVKKIGDKFFVESPRVTVVVMKPLTESKETN